ncbi:MAG: hypothetical protein GXP06_13055 [Alphaproteobacteria bacterium]|nr:hypothetical protein [Alphaproteobacteria bacterium]
MSNDTVIEKARTKIAWHYAEAKRLQAFIEVAVELLGDVSPESQASKIVKVGAVRNPSVRQVTTSTPEILHLTHQLLSSHGPMTAAEIFDRLISRGVSIGGKNPKGNLSAKFATDKTLRHNKDTGRWNQVGPTDKGSAETEPSSVTGEVRASPNAGSRPVTPPNFTRAN